jgi:hypothetical protein
MLSLRYTPTVHNSGEERREFQRLELDPPIPGSLGVTAVSILEIGVLGARVHHGAPLDVRRADLRFAFGDAEIGMQCEVIRTVESRDAKYPGSGLESGVRFTAAIGESGDALREMLGTLVMKELERRRVNSTPLAASEIDGDKTVRGTEAAFTCYRLVNGAWSRRPVFLPEQPAAGFTVARGQDQDEMQRLCLVYAASDDEGRRLIRLFAELSVSDALQIPPRAS